MNADYLVVVSHTAADEIVNVDYVTHKGETYLGCRAFQMRSGGVRNAQAMMAWLERLCGTLTIK